MWGRLTTNYQHLFLHRNPFVCTSSIPFLDLKRRAISHLNVFLQAAPGVTVLQALQLFPTKYSGMQTDWWLLMCMWQLEILLLPLLWHLLPDVRGRVLWLVFRSLQLHLLHCLPHSGTEVCLTFFPPNKHKCQRFGSHVMDMWSALLLLLFLRRR